MRLSASRIRSINRAIARVNESLWSDGPHRIRVENPKTPTGAIPPNTTRIVAIPKAHRA